MNKTPPSIFNDVLGPVMRGPSSSHTAASVRIGRLVAQSLPGRCKFCRVDFDPQGSLASTYHGQGTDIGLAGGLLNMELTDPNLVNSLAIARSEGMAVSFHLTPYEAFHPNTYRITAAGEDGDERQFIFVSTGGGMIELRQFGSIPVSVCGDYHETLFLFRGLNEANAVSCKERLKLLLPGADHYTLSLGENEGLIVIKSCARFKEEAVARATRKLPLIKAIRLEPVLPVLSRTQCTVPFQSAAAALALAEAEDLPMWELALRYECARGNFSAEKACKMAAALVRSMSSSVREGLKETPYTDRILGSQAKKISQYQNRLIGGKTLSLIIANTAAVMETKSSMGIIVAAPTAGSCGVLPGALLTAASVLKLNRDALVKGLLAAGIIGVLIAARSSFAAEECGCQAECGSASAMAAAGLVQMAGGTARQALDAASMALQNTLGLVCDPVAERVEVPCLGKNVLASLNAFGCANMALADFDKVIPLDEAIEALDQVGRALPPALRCTGGAGLSATATAREIHRRLNPNVDLSSQ